MYVLEVDCYFQWTGGKNKAQPNEMPIHISIHLYGEIDEWNDVRVPFHLGNYLY